MIRLIRDTMLAIGAPIALLVLIVASIVTGKAFKK